MSKPDSDAKRWDMNEAEKLCFALLVKRNNEAGAKIARLKKRKERLVRELDTEMASLSRSSDAEWNEGFSTIRTQALATRGLPSDTVVWLEGDPPIAFQTTPPPKAPEPPKDEGKAHEPSKAHAHAKEPGAALVGAANGGAP